MMLPGHVARKRSIPGAHTAPLAPAPWSRTKTGPPAPWRSAASSTSASLETRRPLFDECRHALGVVAGLDEDRLTEPLEDAAGFGIDVLTRVDDVLRHAHRQRCARQQDAREVQHAVHERLVWNNARRETDVVGALRFDRKRSDHHF